MADKITQAQAGYGVRATSIPCVMCLRYDAMMMSCSLVAGRIMPSASCHHAADKLPDALAEPSKRTGH
jgi:hypothetical protein